MLHPLQPLNLQDQQIIQLQLLELAPIAGLPNFLDQLRDSGLVTIATKTPENAISDQALAAFVNSSTPTIPTSQIIIEERGEW